MSAVARRIVLAANASATVDLGPFNRFGGGGGRLAVRAATSAAGATNISVLVGSDTLANNIPILAVGAINNETNVIAGLGAPSDPITIDVTDTGAGSTVEVLADIQNA